MNVIKNIAILVPSLENGGMERVASQVASILVDIGYSLYAFVYQYEKKNAYEFNGKIVYVPGKISNISKKQEVISYLIDAEILKGLKNKHKIDMTISFGQEYNLLNVLSGTNDKKILTIHNCMSLRRDISSIAYSKFAMYMCNKADKIITVSQWCANDIKKNYFVDSKRLKTIYNPAVIKRHSIRQKQEPVILYIGRLEEIKQPWHILKAFVYVKNKIKNAKLLICGRGPEEKNLKQLTKKLGLCESVEFLGFVKNVDEIYNQAKVLVLSSKSEAMPCVVIEALSNGVPLVASDFPGGVSECLGTIMTDENTYPKEYEKGILVKDFSGFTDKYCTDIYEEEELGIQLIRVLNDDVLYSKMVANCLNGIDIFDINSIKKEWKKIVEECKE